MICVVIGRTRHKMMQIEIQEAAKQGAELIELRLDFLAKAPDFKRLLDEKPCSLVATLRRQQDGGRWPGTEEQRKMLLRQATVAGFDWIDVETDIANEIRRFKDVKRIVSYHNMREVPADLEKIHEQMCQQDPDVVKIAVLAQKPADNLRVLNLIKDAPKPTLAFCMGDIGFASRILSAKYGAPFTYGAFNKERGIAPGMPSFQELKKMYGFERINAQTEIFGVIGDPVIHSLSPLIHNRGFRKMGYNGVYLPFRVPRGQLPAFLEEFAKFPVRGYSVTIPHKEAALAAAKHANDLATRIKAANTLIQGDDGLYAYNTDAQAALDSLRANLPPPSEGQLPFNEWTALILGAGGVARAIAHVLQQEGCKVIIANRTADRAQKLAEDVGCRHVVWEGRHNVKAELLVNCTSVGMYPHVDDCPMHHSFFKPGVMVFDTIYTPETTMLIKEARGRGCHVLTGVDMFVRQAALQFSLFTNLEPPIDLMRESVKRALSPLNWRGET